MTTQKQKNNHLTLKLKTMKKLILAALIAVSITTSAFADVTVNAKITENFQTEFYDATNVVWTVSNNFAKAVFTVEGEKMEAFYNLDGSTIGVSKTLALDKLPKNALKTITKKYPFPPYVLKECIEFTNADGEKKFYVSLEEAKTKLILEVSATGAVDIFKNNKIK